MFGKNTARITDTVNLLGKGTTVSGDVTLQGDFRLDGKLDGNLNVSGRLVLGPEGLITGNVVAENADISGEIRGDVKIRQLLHLKNTCRIQGDLECDRLIVDSGAQFNGLCKMGATLKNLSQVLSIDNKLHEVVR